MLIDFRADRAAIADTGALVGAERPSVALAKGLLGGDVKFLGRGPRRS